MQRTWNRNDDETKSPSGGQEESPERPRSPSSSRRKDLEDEPETCWDRLMDRLMPAHLETEPCIKDPVQQERMKWAIFVLAWIAWILGFVSIFGCSFIKTGDSHLKFTELDAYGLFRAAYYDPSSSSGHTNLGCIRYTDDLELDSRGLKTSRFCAIVALICLTVMVFLVTMAVLFAKSRGKRKIFYWLVRFIVFPTLFCHCLTFIMFGGEDDDESNTKTKPGFTGFAAIINAFVIFTMGMLVVFCPCPEEPFLARYVRREELPRKDENEDRDGELGHLDEYPPEQPRPITKSSRNDNNDKNSNNDLPKEGFLPSNRVLVPELGDNDKGVDIKVEKVAEGLKVSERVTHLDGTKTVKSYVKSVEEPPKLT